MTATKMGMVVTIDADHSRIVICPDLGWVTWTSLLTGESYTTDLETLIRMLENIRLSQTNKATSTDG